MTSTNVDVNIRKCQMLIYIYNNNNNNIIIYI